MNDNVFFDEVGITERWLMPLQEVVGCAVVCADYSDHLWLAVEEVVIGAGSC